MTTATITVGTRKERITHHPRHSLINCAGLSFLHERGDVNGVIHVSEPCCDCPPKELKQILPGETLTFEWNGKTFTVEHNSQF